MEIHVETMIVYDDGVLGGLMYEPVEVQSYDELDKVLAYVQEQEIAQASFSGHEYSILVSWHFHPNPVMQFFRTCAEWLED